MKMEIVVKYKNYWNTTIYRIDLQPLAVINNYIALLYFVLAKTKYKRADHMTSQISLSEIY